MRLVKWGSLTWAKERGKVSWWAYHFHYPETYTMMPPALFFRGCTYSTAHYGNYINGYNCMTTSFSHQSAGRIYEKYVHGDIETIDQLGPLYGDD